MQNSALPDMVRYFEREIKKRLEANSRINRGKNVVRHPSMDLLSFNPYDLTKCTICFSIGSTMMLVSTGEYVSLDNDSSILWKAALTHLDRDLLCVPLTTENAKGKLLFSVFSYDDGNHILQDILAFLPAALFPLLAHAYSPSVRTLHIHYCYDPDFSKKRKAKAHEEKLGFVPLHTVLKAFRE